MPFLLGVPAMFRDLLQVSPFEILFRHHVREALRTPAPPPPSARKELALAGDIPRSLAEILLAEATRTLRDRAGEDYEQVLRRALSIARKVPVTWPVDPDFPSGEKSDDRSRVLGSFVERVRHRARGVLESGESPGRRGFDAMRRAALRRQSGSPVLASRSYEEAARLLGTALVEDRLTPAEEIEYELYRLRALVNLGRAQEGRELAVRKRRRGPSMAHILMHERTTGSPSWAESLCFGVRLMEGRRRLQEEWRDVAGWERPGLEGDLALDLFRIEAGRGSAKEGLTAGERRRWEEDRETNTYHSDSSMDDSGYEPGHVSC